MEWNTIPVELLERILVFTKSPYAVGNALMTCKNWNEVEHDPHLWQQLYLYISGIVLQGDSSIDWKKKVTDLVLVRQNVKHGRCVVRTLATSQGLQSRVTLGIENPSVYKDYFLCGWLEEQNFGSYGGVSRVGSHIIDMVREEATDWSFSQKLLINNYVATSPTSYYGGADLSEVKVQHFDPNKVSTLHTSPSVSLNLSPGSMRGLIRNYCPDSNYMGFHHSKYPSKITTIEIANAESGSLAVSLRKNFDSKTRQLQLYDAYLAVSDNSNVLEIIDVRTNTVVAQRYVPDANFGFMTENTIALHLRKNIVLWNYIENSEVVYEAGEVPHTNIEMLYHDMWVVYNTGMMSFYDIKDGSLINTLLLRKGGPNDQISLLSDGRLCVANRCGCRVISFVDSEVNRKVKVELMEVNGAVATHEINAHELPQFFVEQVGKPLEMMTSRVVNYAEKKSDGRFVLICTQDEKNKSQPENATATKLWRTASGKSSRVNTPYQAWKFDQKERDAILLKDYIVDRVCGKAIIVHEVKIDGRWQLADNDRLGLF